MKLSVSSESKCGYCGQSKSSLISKVSNRDSSGMVKLFEHVHASGIENFRGCRIVVGVHFNMLAWRSKLKDYEDKVVCEYLEFGFPLDFNKKKKLCFDIRRNHKGAREFPKFIKQYFRRECKEVRVAGPFIHNPLSVPLMISPMNSVPKVNSTDERRVIVDLSWPRGAAVNEGISKDIYLGEVIDLHYASVEQVCQMVVETGVGAVIYKRDLRRAYRQIPVDPRDYRYLGYFWEEHLYFDSVLAMGQRNAAMACSRTTKAVMYMHSEAGYRGTSYLDDLIGVADINTGTEAYENLGQLLAELGLIENYPKACPPSTVQIVLGIEVNTIEGTLSVPSGRMAEILELLGEWRGKCRTNKVDLQSLIGKLQFVTKCVRQSRVFLNRMLDTLRAMNQKSSIKLSESFQKDVKWWDMFMDEFNGVAYFPSMVWSEPDINFATDSCLLGCGGLCGYEFFHSAYPSSILSQGLPIHCLEMLAVLIAVRFWGHHCTSGKIQIYCDNEPVVQVINSSKTKDVFMASCLRELWLEVSKYGFELRAVHLPGVENRVPDWLSRWELHPSYAKSFHQFIAGEADMYKEVVVTDELFQFSGDL